MVSSPYERIQRRFESVLNMTAFQREKHLVKFSSVRGLFGNFHNVLCADRNACLRLEICSPPQVCTPINTAEIPRLHQLANVISCHQRQNSATVCPITYTRLPKHCLNVHVCKARISVLYFAESESCGHSSMTNL